MIKVAEDGETELYVDHIPYDQRRTVALPNGIQAIELSLSFDHRAFVSRDEDLKGAFAVSVDPANFASEDESRLFRAEVRKLSDVDFRLHFRKSEFPEPELLLTLFEGFRNLSVTDIVALLGVGPAATKFGVKLGDEIANDLLKFYRLAKSAPVAMLRYGRPRGRAVTTVYVVAGNPRVDFVVRSRKPWVFKRAPDLARMREFVGEADELKASMGAKEVQYLFDEKDGWAFNYFVTDTGNTVGTKKAIDKHAQLIETRVRSEGKRTNSKREK
jgi:hypothetical protein